MFRIVKYAFYHTERSEPYETYDQALAAKPKDLTVGRPETLVTYEIEPVK